MATIKVTGKVGAELGNSGFYVLEPITTFDGRSFDKKWKVWTPRTIAEGETVTVEGDLTAKVSTYEFEGETKHNVDLSINNPVVTTETPTPF